MARANGATKADARPTAAPPRLLLVEDDPALRSAMAAALEAVGYDVRTISDGTQLDTAVRVGRPDLVLLDVGFPKGPDGFTLAEQVRAMFGIPVLFVTAADGLHDRLRGFEAGGDDYIVKPFAMAELLARVRVVLRRVGRLTSACTEVGDVVIDEASQTVLRSGAVVDLTSTEFELLRTMAAEPGRVFTKPQLLTMVWGFDEFDPNLVEVHVSALRKKLEADGAPRIVHTERGQGYLVRR